MTRILLADDHAIVRSGIRKALENVPGMQVSAEAHTIDGLLEQLDSVPVDLLILDISMRGRSGLDALPEIKRRWPNVAVLIYTVHSDEDLIAGAFTAGVAGFLTKDSSVGELVDAIKAVVSEGRYISKLAGTTLAKHVASGSQPAHYRLSPREFEVMVSIAAGKSLKEIGRERRLNPKTVSTYRERILKKMGLRTNADLTRYAAQNQMLPG